MKKSRRKIEVHRLTISGLPEGIEYGSFLLMLRRSAPDLKHIVWEHGEKSHVLFSAGLKGKLLQMLFASYSSGNRPDILDTEKFSVSPSPLEPTQTGIEWTHILGGSVNGRYILLIEKRQAGIWPTTVEEYFDWLFSVASGDRSFELAKEMSAWPVVVSLEAEPGDNFIKRLDALDRVTSARIRIVRPNPGWKDLEAELGKVADESDAHKAEVVARARPRSSLEKGKGLVRIISELFHSKSLDFAELEGRTQGQHDKFNSKHLNRFQFAELNVNDAGQVIHSEAWDKLADIHKKLGQ